MFLLRFFRFITGFVIFEGTGGFPERFLNLCSLNGINIWDAKSSQGVLCAKTNISCYRKIRPCARRSGMKLKVKEKHGLPFLMRPYLKRKGLISGTAISAVIIFILSSCVWTVSISGNEKFTDEQIIQIAQAYGVKQGKFRHLINPDDVRENIKADIDAVNWFSVNTDGTNVSLEVLENSGGNEILDLTTPCNIVSSTDGELLKLEVYKGDAALRPGNAVTKGELLISGVIERADGSSDFVHARGKAIIRTKQEIRQTVPLNISCKKLKDKKNRYSAEIFTLRIFPGIRGNSDTLRTEKSMLQYNDISLPVGIITDTCYICYDEKITLSTSQAKLLCRYGIFLEEREIMTNSQNESKTVNITYSDKDTTSQIIYINHNTGGIEYYFTVNNE